MYYFKYWNELSTKLNIAITDFVQSDLGFLF